jgi:predicted DNA-binding ribbon-helix-helix protein
MDQKPKGKEISGWYAHEEMTEAEKISQMREVERWYEKRHRLNYRTVPVEMPGKMMLTLGRMAAEQQISFSQFIEKILEGYLRGHKGNRKGR